MRASFLAPIVLVYYAKTAVVIAAAPVADVTTNISTAIVPPIPDVQMIISPCLTSSFAARK